MKKYFLLFSLSLSFILASCSTTEQEISPLSPRLEKSTKTSLPYQLYQTFPEVKVTKLDYYYSNKGLVITFNPLLTKVTHQLFAVIEFAGNSDPDPLTTKTEASMVFLGNPFEAKYLIPALTKKEIRSIHFYGYSYKGPDIQVAFPYPKSQLFNKLGIKGWSDGSNSVKVSSETFPFGMKHLFAQMICEDKSMLVFLGKPQFNSFEFPKSADLEIYGLRLFTYSNPIRDLQ